jgi:serine/threonine-protein kinase
VFERWCRGEASLNDVLADTGALTPLELAEVLSAEQHRRWEAEDHVAVEHYLQQYPVLVQQPAAACELIYGEFLLRQQWGETPDFREYLQRFPQLTDGLQRIHAREQSADRSTGPGAFEPPGSVVDTVLAPRDGERRSEAPAPQVPTTAVPAEAHPQGPWETFDPENCDVPFIGKYRVVEHLGSGGQGDVFRAVHPELKRDVVIKWARQPLPAAVHQRLIDEGQILARLDDPGLVRVYDVDVYQGRPFTVLEYVPGRSLAQRLEEGLPEARAAATLVARLALIVARVHQHGVLHCDLKPGNVLLDVASQPRLLDFGLAWTAPLWGEAKRPEDGVRGSYPYMAPEQANGQGGRIGPRTDVFGLGAVLYALLSGRPPYQATDPMALWEQARQGKVVPPRQLNPRVPRALERICLKALAAEPEQRYASAWEFASALHRYMRRRLLAAVLAGTLLLTTAVLGLALGHPPQTKTQPPPPPADTLPVEERLKVLRLDVRHFATVPRAEGPQIDPRGVLGQGSFDAHLGDYVTVEAQLSRPAYAYLICFRPDGEADICFPEQKDERPPETDRPCYPSKKRDKNYCLEEGTGLWVFALLVSHQPLPAYREWEAEWKAARQPPPWKGERATAGVVWHDDGAIVLALTAADPTGQRAKDQDMIGKTPVVALADWLRQDAKADAVVVIGFSVLPRAKP